MDSSSNPALKKSNIDRLSKILQSSETMSISGSLLKICWLLVVLVSVAAWSWSFTEQNPTSALTITMISSISAFIIGMIIIFKKPNPVLVTLYAGLEGVVIGAVSFLFGTAYQGIVAQAILFTISITIGMLFLYATKLVRVTEKLKSIILISTLGVLLFYFLSFIISLFSSSFSSFVSTGTSGIFIASIIVIIASLNLLLDFDFIDQGVEKELPKSSNGTAHSE